MAFITIAGQNQIAKKQGENTTLNITKFVLANVPNLGSEPATRIENIPNSSVVDQLNVTKSGYVNTNQVVYSLVMGSNIGDYSFNWVGLVDDEGVLIAVTYIPLTSKTKNNGGVAGNTFTRNFLLAYTGIQQTTAINVPAETWQIDFSARLSGIDERERLANFDIYGHEGFLADGWKVTGANGTYSVAAGIGYIGGVRAKNTAPQEITTATFPNEIWLNVSLQGDISDMTAVCEFVIDMGPFADYVDENGIEHYLTRIATIESNKAVTDSRVIYDPRDASRFNKGTIAIERLPAGANGGIDAAKLEGKGAEYYLDASNLKGGKVPAVLIPSSTSTEILEGVSDETYITPRKLKESGRLEVKKYEGPPVVISSGGEFTISHGLKDDLGNPVIPFGIGGYIECIADDGPYVAGNKTPVSLIANSSATDDRSTTCRFTALQIYIKFSNQPGSFSVGNPDGGSLFVINNSKWHFRLTAWY